MMRKIELFDVDVLKFYARLNQENKEFVDAHSFAIYTSNKNSVILEFRVDYTSLLALMS